EWWTQLDEMRSRYPLGWDEPPDGTLAPQQVLKRLGEVAGPDAIYVAGVGQHQMWASQFISYEKPGTWLNSGGLGTMGYAVPAAMGAKVGCPDRTVWAVDGDGCFQMTNQELAMCALEGIPIKVAGINNGNPVLVENKPSVLARVSGLFSRRGFNIDSLAVGETENPEVSRITIVVNAEASPLEQVTKQLNKLVNVLKIVELEPSASVQRELLLVKVRADRPVRGQVLETVQLFRARVVDVAADTLTI